MLNTLNKLEIEFKDRSDVCQKIISTLKNPIFALIWIGLALSSYLFFDRSIAIYMHHLNNPMVNDVAQFLTRFGLSTWYLIITVSLFIVTTFWIKRPAVSGASLFIFLAVVIPGLTCDIFKVILGRARPTELFHHHIYGFQFLQFKASMWSFPSGHSTTIAGVMMGLMLLFPRFWAPFLSFTALVALSRVVVTAHYLSDVMVGSYLGALMVIYLYQNLVKSP